MIDPKRHPRLDRIRKAASWQDYDQYPTSVELADEHERWLQFLEARWQLDRYANALQGGRGQNPHFAARQRMKTFAEVGVGYFLEIRCGLPIIIWEPARRGEPRLPGEPTGDFLAWLRPAGQLFVEVKARGWEEEVGREEMLEKDGLMRPRVLLTKYPGTGEGRWTNPMSQARKAVADAYEHGDGTPVFPDSMPTLLVIADDFFWPLHEVGYDSAHRAFYGSGGSFTDRSFERLGAVGVFTFEWWMEQEAVYKFALFRNPYALPTVGVPSSAFEGYATFQRPPWVDRPPAERVPLVPGRRPPLA